MENDNSIQDHESLGNNHNQVLNALGFPKELLDCDPLMLREENMRVISAMDSVNLFALGYRLQLESIEMYQIARAKATLEAERRILKEAKMKEQEAVEEAVRRKEEEMSKIIGEKLIHQEQTLHGWARDEIETERRICDQRILACVAEANREAEEKFVKELKEQQERHEEEVENLKRDYEGRIRIMEWARKVERARLEDAESRLLKEMRGSLNKDQEETLSTIVQLQQQTFKQYIEEILNQIQDLKEEITYAKEKLIASESIESQADKRLQQIEDDLMKLLDVFKEVSPRYI